MAKKVELLPQKRMNKTVSHLPGVKVAVWKQAKKIATKAEAKLAPHHKEFQSRIEIGRGTVDSVVSLVDPAALSIEFGHFSGSRGRVGRTYVPGLHLFQGYRFMDGV